MSYEFDFDGLKFVSSKRAAKVTGYTQDYIGQLSRAKKISSRMIGRSRYVAIQELIDYKNLQENQQNAFDAENIYSRLNDIERGLSIGGNIENKILENSVDVFKSVNFTKFVNLRNDKPILNILSRSNEIENNHVNKDYIDSGPLFPDLTKKIDLKSVRYIALQSFYESLKKSRSSVRSRFESGVGVSLAFVLFIMFFTTIFFNDLNPKKALVSTVDSFASGVEILTNSSLKVAKINYLEAKGQIERLGFDSTNNLAATSVAENESGIGGWFIGIGRKILRPWFETPATVVIEKETVGPTVVVREVSKPVASSLPTVQSKYVYIPSSDRNYIDTKISELRDYFLTSSIAPNVNRFYVTRQNDVIADLSGQNNSSGGGGSSNVATLDDLSDITLGSVSFGDLLMFNGSNWVNTATSSLGLFIGNASSTLLSDSNTWSGVNRFNSLLTNLYSSSTIYSSFATASSTNLNTGFLTFATSTAGTLKTNSSGLVWVDTSSGGSSASSTLLADSNTWTGANRFNSLLTSTYASSTYSSFATASTTNLILGGINFNSGNISQWTNDAGYKTFNFPFTVSTAYNSTSTIIGFNGIFSTASSTFSGPIRTPSLSDGFAYVGSGTLQTVSTSTALGSKQDILVSGTNIKTINGSSVLGSGDLTVTGGSGLASSTPWTFGSLIVAKDNGSVTTIATSTIRTSELTNDAGFITSTTTFGSGYATTTQNALTFSTSTLSFNGLTLGETIVPTSGALTFTPTVTGTLNNTGLTNSTISGISLGSNLADLTATNSTLTFSGTYNGGTARTIGLNLGNPNTWSALQTFNYSSSTIYSSFATASSTNLNTGFLTFATSTAGTLKTNSSGLVWVDTSGSGSSASSTLLSDFNTFSNTNNFTGKLGLASSSPFARFGVETQAGDVWGFAVGSSTKSLLSVSTEGFGTTTLAGLSIVGQATSTSNVGFNISSGCYAVGGNCIGSGGGGSGASTTLLADFNTFSNTNNFTGRVGLASSTPWGQLSINPNGIGSGVPEFVVGSSTATHFVVSGNGNVGIGTIASMASSDKLTVNGTAVIGGTSNSQGTTLYVNGSAYINSALYANNGNDGVESFSFNTLNRNRSAGTAATLSFGMYDVNFNPHDYGRIGTVITSNTDGAETGDIYFKSSNLGTLAERMRLTGAGNLGLGTTTPFGQLSVNPNNIGSGPSFVVGSSTATQLSVASGGFGTTTLAGLSIVGQATSTSNVGFNLTTGCYAIGGSCIGGGGGSGLSSYDAWTHPSLGISATTSALSFPYSSSTIYSSFATASSTNLNTGFLTFATSTAGTLKTNSSGLVWVDTSGSGSSASSTLLSDSNTFSGTNNFTQKTGFATSSPFARLSVESQAGEAAFVVGSSTKTSFLVDSSGKVVIGSSSATTSAKKLYISDDGLSDWTSYSRHYPLWSNINNTPIDALKAGQNMAAILGTIDIPSSATSFSGGAGGMFFARTAAGGVWPATERAAEAVRAEARIAANGGGAFGITSLVESCSTDCEAGGTSFSASYLANEFDINNYSAGTSQATGIYVVSGSTNQATIFDGVSVSITPSAPVAWKNAFKSFSGAAEVGLYLGQLSSGASQSSQPIYFQNADSGNNARVGAIDMDSLGVMRVTSPSTLATSGFKVQLANGFNLLNLTNNGNAGMGTSTPFSLLQIATSSGIGFKPQLSLTDTSAGSNLKHWSISSLGGNFYISTSTDTYATSSLAAITINSNGNVGIGNQNPNQKLDIVGNISVNGNITTTGTAPDYFMNETDAATNEKIWDSVLSSGTLSYRTINDAVSNAQTWMQVTRQGFLVNAVSFPNGKVGVGTSTPGFLMQLSSTTASATFKPQLALSDQSAGTNLKHWTLSSQGGNFYLSSSTDTYATSSVSALEISGSGFGTTTLRGLNISGQATSTSNVGFNLTTGCYAIGGSCIGGGGGSSQWTTSGTSIYYNGGNVGIGTTTPRWNLQVASSTAPQLVLTDSDSYDHWTFRNQSGNFYLSSSSPTTFATSTDPALEIKAAGTFFNTPVVVTGGDRTISSGPYKLNVNGITRIKNILIGELGSSFIEGGAAGGGIGGNIGFQNAASDSFTITSALNTSASNVFTLNARPSGSSENLLQLQKSASPILTVSNDGNLGLGTTTPFGQLSVNPNNIGSGPSFVVGSSTATQLSVASGGFGTTTLAGLSIVGQATSTSNVGFNITNGCYAINGTCVSGGVGGGSGTVNSGVFGQLAFYGANGTAVSGTSTITVSTTTASGRVGIATSTDLNATLTLQGAIGTDILNIATSTSGRNVITISEWGGFVQKVSSTTALSIQMASGTPVFEVDTTSNTNSGIDITAGTGQTSNLMNLYSSGGTFLSGFTAAGGLHMNISSSTAIDVLNGSGVSAFTVNSSSKSVGIGTSTLTYNLNVEGSQASDYIQRIYNASTDTTADGLLISLGVANASRTTSNYFVGFSDGAGTVAGKIQGGASAVAYTTSAADIAEYFRISDLNNAPESGEIVMLDTFASRAVKKSDTQNIATEPLGIVSTNPGFIGNAPICFVDDVDCDKEYAKYNVLVALAGQVPLKVTDENGPVVIGDYLTLSKTVPGAAMKAVESGYIVGTAITNASSTIIASTTSVVALVRSGWRNIGNDDVDMDIVATSTDSIIQTKFASLFDFLKGVGFEIGQNFVKITNLIADKLVAKRIETEELCVGNTCVNQAQLAALIQMSGVVSIGGNVDIGTSTPEIVGTSTPPIASSTPLIIEEVATSTPEIVVEEPGVEEVETTVIDTVPEIITENTQ